jgi:hypothetical protein
MVVIVFFLVFSIMPHLDRNSSFVKLKLLGLVLLATLPWITFEVFVPRKFNVTAKRDTIEYEFADHSYGLGFIELNKDRIIKIS